MPLMQWPAAVRLAPACAHARFWCSPTTSARWGWCPTRSSTSSKEAASPSKSPAPLDGIPRLLRPSRGMPTEVIDVGHFRSPRWRVPTVSEPQGKCGRPSATAQSVLAASTTPRSSAICWAGAQGRRVSRARLPTKRAEGLVVLRVGPAVRDAIP